MEAIYNVNLKWSSDRRGVLNSPEIHQKIEVATPPPFPHGVEGMWSPEHLLTSAVVSCFMTTFLAIAENSKLQFNAFKCESKGKLEQVNGQFLITEITLVPTLEIGSENDLIKAQKVLAKSEKACLISNSIKSTVIMSPKIIITEFIS